MVFSGNAPLAKLDIASVYGTEGQEFESLTVHQERHGIATDVVARVSLFFVKRMLPFVFHFL